MAVRTAYAPTAGEVLTAANLAKVAGGWIGYAEATAAQTGIAAANTDLTSLSVAVTVGNARRIKVSWFVVVTQVTSAAGSSLRAAEGATQLNLSSLALAATESGTHTGAVILTPTSGAHTYKLTLATGAGTINTIASATIPCWILVEDIGTAT